MKPDTKLQKIQSQAILDAGPGAQRRGPSSACATISRRPRATSRSRQRTSGGAFT